MKNSWCCYCLLNRPGTQLRLVRGIFWLTSQISSNHRGMNETPNQFNAWQCSPQKASYFDKILRKSTQPHKGSVRGHYASPRLWKMVWVMIKKLFMNEMTSIRFGMKKATTNAEINVMDRKINSYFFGHFQVYGHVWDALLCTKHRHFSSPFSSLATKFCSITKNMSPAVT